MNKVLKRAGLGLAAAAALVAGSFTGVAVAAASAPSAEQSSAISLLNEFRVTEQGLTFGFVDQGLADDPNARPDLVAVTTDDGKDGWAYSSEYMPWIAAKTPEQSRSLNTDKPYSVPVYALDGETLIGHHTVNRPAEK